MAGKSANFFLRFFVFGNVIVVVGGATFMLEPDPYIFGSRPITGKINLSDSLIHLDGKLILGCL